MMRLALTNVLIVAVAGCTGTQSVTLGIEKPPGMAEAVLSEIPVGTPVEDAERFMVREGFACIRATDAEFLDRKGLDYIYCDRTEGETVQRRWQIAVVHNNGEVAEIIASTGLVAP
ncbi:hypothetical protein [Roseimaritima sediminicola]|uniref:hypothetical protein n=1 Tax=Roseimaritima sediminicola TaxID=2662066 RepID=UPI00129835BB|nr:hypothetical protein [Roseimaritima sediminicola]